MMPKTRLEAFSDGVMAIIITIMVLELKVPHGDDLSALQPLLPVFFSYVLSFVYIGIYWNNHHHMMHAVKRVTGGVLWANLHLLFWLSLLPFATGWMGENHFAPIDRDALRHRADHGRDRLFDFVFAIINEEGTDSLLAKAVGKDLKGKLSVVAYAVAIALSFFNHWISAGDLRPGRADVAGARPAN